MKQSEYTETGPYLIAGKHIYNGVINWDECDHLSVERYEESPEIALKKGDVIFSKDGSLGNPALIKELPSEATINGTMMLVRLKSKVSPNFFYQILNSDYFFRLIHILKSGSSVPHIFQRDMENFKFKIPSSLEEQNKISKFLENIDRKIELLETKQNNYVNFKKYMMQQIFTQKLRFDFEGEWKKIPFKKLLNEIIEKTTINNQHEVLSSTMEGIFTQKEYFADRNVASKDNTGYKILRKHQIVLSPQNLWMGNINVNEDFDIGIVSPSYKIYETTDLIDISYFKHVIKLPRLIYEYKCASEQGASIVRRNLNKQLFGEITINVPSLEEQKYIGNLFNCYDKKIKQISNQIENTKEFKKGLLQQMFV